MRNRLLFILSGLGILLGIAGAVYFGIRHPPQPPAFQPAANPYDHGIFANGIIESSQASGENLNVNPEVSGAVSRVLVHEGDVVAAGAPLFEVEPSVQQATAAQLESQAAAAASALDALQHQPRPEVLAVAAAARQAAAASLRQVSDQRDKLVHAHELDARAVSAETLDTAENAVRVAAAALEVADRQLQLTRAGAWSYDLEAQQRTLAALRQQAAAARALLAKYTVRAPVAGRVIALGVQVGSYVSPAGTYDSYTQGATPAAVMSSGQGTLAVRVYVDEILVAKLPPAERMVAQMQVRGTDLKVPLQFVRIQPYVTPKIELSDQRAERVDLRVLPVLFRFAPPSTATLYPGQLVDVYIGSR